MSEHEQDLDSGLEQGSSLGANRREFVIASARNLVGLCGGIYLGTRPQRTYASTLDGIQIGLVGCGGRGSNLVRLMTKYDRTNRLVAMGDLFPEKIETSLQSMKDARKRNQVSVTSKTKFVGFDAYREVVDASVDFVVLATPAAFRPAHFAAVVEAGKHAYVEKPIAVDSPGVRWVLESNEQAKRKQLHVSSGLTHRHSDRHRELLAQVAPLDIQQMEITLHGGVWRMMPRISSMSELEYQIRNFRRFAWLGGGHMLEGLVHSLDNINRFVGSLPISASGTGTIDPNVGPDRGDVFDRFSTQFDYRNGVILNATMDYTRAKGMKEEIIRGDGWWASISHGALYQDSNRATWKHIRADPFNDNQIKGIISNLKRGGAINEIGYACNATYAAIMGRTAACLGRQVTWDEIVQSSSALAPKEITSMDAAPPTRPDKFGDYIIGSIG